MEFLFNEYIKKQSYCGTKGIFFVLPNKNFYIKFWVDMLIVTDLFTIYNILLILINLIKENATIIYTIK